jgi:hypothetical protein
MFKSIKIDFIADTLQTKYFEKLKTRRRVKRKLQ